MKTYARIVTARLKPAMIDDAVTVLHDRVEPSLRAEQGFRNSELLVNRTTGRMAIVSHFDSETDAQAGGAAHFQERTAMVEPFLDSSPELEIYEVEARP
jgi:quinol monooxygenase YgiN